MTDNEQELVLEIRAAAKRLNDLIYNAGYWHTIEVECADTGHTTLVKGVSVNIRSIALKIKKVL